MDRRVWFLSAVFVAQAWAGSNQACAEGSSPNIVVILADDLGYGDLGYQGNTFHETPNIDRLANESVRFDTAYAAAPLCTPSRAALMTGKQPGRMHLTRAISHHPGPPASGGPASPSSNPWQEVSIPANANHLALAETTYAELLRDAGYCTGYVGKWHIGSSEFGPGQQGFDLLGTVTAHGGVFSYYPPYGADDIQDQKNGEFLADRLTADALRLLDRMQQQKQPFCLTVAYLLPHVPLMAPADLVQKYEAKAKSVRYDGLPVYAAMIDKLDQCVGVILDRLKELGLDENTIVVFSSDNGGVAYDPTTGHRLSGNGGLRGGKTMVYEGGVRIPLLMRVPRVQSFSADAQVSLMDILPTLLELAGHADAIPDGIDGRSVAAVLRGKTLPPRDWTVFWPHYVGANVYEPVARLGQYASEPSATLRQGDYKLIDYFGARRSELYHLKNDVSETHDLASSMPEKTDAMEIALAEDLKSSQMDLPRLNEAYSPRWSSIQYFGLTMWLAYDSDLRVIDGNIHMACQAPDPFLKCLNPYVPEAGPCRLVFRARGTVRGGLQGYYADTADPQKQNLVPVAGELSKDWNEFSMAIPTDEKLVNFRIDWGVFAGDVEVDWLRLEDSNGAVICNWDH